MATVNGKKYTTFGQGYAAEKAKGGKQEEPDGDEKEMDGKEGSGSEMMVKHMGGGRFKTKSKHHDGKMTNEEHESPEELHAHMAQHFGHDDAPAEEMGSEPEEGIGQSVRSILG